MTPREKALALYQWKQGGKKPGSIPLQTLYRWDKRCRGLEFRHWAGALTRKHGGGRSKVEIPDEAWEYFTGVHMTLLAPPLTESHRRTVEAAAREGWGKLPSLDTFARRLEDTFSKEEDTFLRHGSAALDKLFPTQRRTVEGMAPLQAINGDGLRADTFVRWEDGTVGRPHIWTWQDIRTRYPLAWEIGRSENTDQIRRAFGTMVKEFGVWCGPAEAFALVDNTRAASNKTLSGGDPNRFRYKFVEGEGDGILKNFGYRVKRSTMEKRRTRNVGLGRSKPVESIHTEMLIKICKANECLGAYTGPGPEAKPEDYGEAAVPIALFRRIVDREMERIRKQEGRRTEIAGGRSLEEIFRDEYERAVNAGYIRPVAEAEHRLYSLARLKVRVRTPAEIHLHRNRYTATELIPHMGKDIHLLYDPENLHESQWAYTLDGTLIGPVRCIADRGFTDTDAARDDMRDRRAQQKHIKASAELKTRRARRSAQAHTHLPEAPDDSAAAAAPVNLAAEARDRSERDERVRRRMAAAAAKSEDPPFRQAQ